MLSAVAVDRPGTAEGFPSRLLTPREAAAVFSVTPKTVARWNDAGILAGERTRGGHRRYPTAAVYELRDFLQGVGAP